MIENFNPDWVSPPADTLRDAINRRGWSVEHFCELSKLSVGTTTGLLNGSLLIDENIAEVLSNTFSVSKGFWLRRQELYLSRLARQEG